MSGKYPRYPAYKDSGVEWLGEVPEHWDVVPVHSVASIVNGFPFKAELFSHEGTLGDRVIRIRDLLGDDDKIHSAEECPTDVLIRNGDLLIGMDGDFNIHRWMRGEAKLNQRVCALKSKDVKMLDFLYYSARQPLSLINDLKYATTVKHLSSSEVIKIRLALPPEVELNNILFYLDTQTARIDALIAEYEKLIALLKEKRQALISHAVTKGLNPGVPMKDSGVEWLGEVPEHWEIKAIKWESIVQRGASPRPIDDPVYFDDQGEYSWVRISDVTASEVYLEEAEQKLSELGADLSVKLEPGTLFLSIAGSVGKPCITQIKCCIHDGFVWFPTWRNSVKYLYYIFDSGQPYKGLGKMGTQLNLNTDTVGSIKVALPPFHEQQAIAAYLDTETAKMDALIQQAEQGIELLKERRTTLISDAVTGKIDVREIAAA